MTLQVAASLGGTLRRAAGVAALLAAVAALSAQPQTPAQQLQEAVRLMETHGEYRAAIALLTSLTKTPDRAVAARAWLYLGLAREQVGHAEAAEAYRQVLAHFADQAATAAEARRRLAAIEQPVATATRARVIRQLHWEGFYQTGAPSLDGRWLPGTSERAATLIDLRTGTRHKLATSSPEPGRLFRLSLAPDGDTIAAEWHPHTPDAPVELLLVSRTDPSVRQRLVRDPDVLDIAPRRWTADGSAVFAVLSRRDSSTELALVMRSGARRTLERLTSEPLGCDMSPDGRFVVYDRLQSPDAAERDILILDTATGQSSLLIDHPANDTWPIWVADGSAVAFVSSRTGPLGVWIVDVVNGRASGEPRRLMAAAGRVTPEGFTRAGAFFYRSMTGLIDIYTMDIDLAGAGRMGTPTKVVAGSVSGASFFSSWAPDGRRLAFTSRHGEVHFQPRSTAMVIHDLVSGTWTEFSPPLLSMSYSAWSPDGRTLLVRGRGHPGPAAPPHEALWTLDVSNGALAPFHFSPHAILSSPAWRPDGRAALFTEHTQDGRTRILERELASGAVREIAGPPASEFELSPDGQWIAFMERDPDAQVLVVAPAAGGERRRLATFDAQRRASVTGWSPDGASVLVGRGLLMGGPEPEPTEVWVIGVADGARRLLGTIPVPYARSLRISPDGRRLSLESGVWDWTSWVMEHAVPAIAPESRPARAAARGRR
jgi:Tol biopolymer transport system component